MASEQKTQVLYSERQWLPWYWWLIVMAMITLFSLQLTLNRNIWWFIVPEIVLGAGGLWMLFWMSSTTITIEEDAEGIRWLTTDGASLPHTVVDRSLAIPESAKRNAMGRQLDPAAFLVSHGWVTTMVMLVLNDDDDPTPYWLISSKNPEAVLRAFLPDQAEQALIPLHNA